MEKVSDTEIIKWALDNGWTTIDGQLGPYLVSPSGVWNAYYEHIIWAMRKQYEEAHKPKKVTPKDVVERWQDVFPADHPAFNSQEWREVMRAVDYLCGLPTGATAPRGYAAAAVLLGQLAMLLADHENKANGIA